VHAEEALASASRILPIVTTAHGVSGSNNTYWPEMYTNMPIVDESRKQPYSDTPKPKRFGAVSPFDPQLFATGDEFAEGRGGYKISPLEVAGWLANLSNRAAKSMAKVTAKDSAECRRWQLDVAILSGLGRFFAEKMQSAVSWRRFEHEGRQGELTKAVDHYTAARNAWAELANLAKGRYSNDISYGTAAHMRGHWLDRLPEIDADLADMRKRGYVLGIRLGKGMSMNRPTMAHLPASRFEPGKALAIELTWTGKELPRMYYRHVNHAERWRMVEMNREKSKYRAAIPGEYTKSNYALQYYFAIPRPWFTGSYGGEHPGLYPGGLLPGFGDDLCGTPYFVVRS